MGQAMIGRAVSVRAVQASAPANVPPPPPAEAGRLGRQLAGLGPPATLLPRMEREETEQMVRDPPAFRWRSRRRCGRLRREPRRP
ncbi:hypothetical protein DVW87_05045 [Sphingomonas aracearum]|uniref:Uncharacterized protein n=1 Tax=Sphingomonas aracearum TaxID=2283317 RepID=A0A369VZG3_9SPHN|nr:hypothetical protein DVW87_05045 [Sphingomonas aracearum]